MNYLYGEYLKKKEEELLSYISLIERKEEMYRNQRSRNEWLQEWDCNTKLFNNLVIQNMHRSKIHKLRVTDGRYVETREEIEEELVNHFKQVMMEDRVNRRQDIAKITQHLLAVIS